jgi:hypothetical protein
VNVIINLLDLENEGNIFVLKVGIQVQVWASSQPERP